MEVQDVFYTLNLVDGEGDRVYTICRKTLENHFTPQSNVPYQRHTFRSMSQEQNETIKQFITRLRIKAETCEFHNIDEHIRDQIIEMCRSNYLRRKLLEKGRELTLQQVRDIARAMEDSEKQAKDMEILSSDVNKVSI